MSMLRPMRDELFKYRKRKKISLDGSVPGAPYVRLRRSRRHVSGMPYVAGSYGCNHDLYMQNNPRSYRPNLNAPAVQSEDYYPDENWESHQISHPTDPRLFRPFPELPVAEDSPSYEKSKSASEFFLKAMEAQYKSFEDGSEIPSLADIWKEHNDISNIEKLAEAEELTPDEIMHKFMDVTDALAHLKDVLPPEHPDIKSLSAAMNGIMNDPQTSAKLDSFAPDTGPSNLGEGDPYEHDDIIPFMNDSSENPQEQFFDASTFNQSLDIQQNAIEQETAFADDFAESNLEQIVEAEQDNYNPDLAFTDSSIPIAEIEEPFQQGIGCEADAAFAEIGQAIDEVQQDPMQAEYDPWRQQYDPFDPNQMFGQYMANPFQIGPDFGPMGPMPGPMM